MSAHVGTVNGPHHNSPSVAAMVNVSRVGAEVIVFRDGEAARRYAGGASLGRAEALPLNLDPIAARNLAALLVLAADQAERMRNGTDGRIATCGYCECGAPASTSVPFKPMRLVGNTADGTVLDIVAPVWLCDAHVQKLR